MEIIRGETSKLGETLDKRKVQEMWDVFLADFRKGDYVHMASYFAENTIYMPAGRETINGRQGVERFWHAAHEQGVRDFKVNVERVETLGNHAYEIGNATVQIRRAADSKETMDSLRYLVVWKRDLDGTWRILVDISNKSSPEKRSEDRGR